MELSFKLDVFEGPLDLLLHLISKHQLNIYDIEISVLLEQYLSYIDSWQEADMEVAGEFLAMAARLIYIKTVSLLPKYDEADELKKELTGELIEYAVCKMMAEKFRSRFVGHDIFVREPLDIPINKTYTKKHEPDRILIAYLNAVGKKKIENEIDETIFKPLVSKRYVSVTSKIVYVLKALYSGKDVELESIYENQATRSDKVAVFLAVLELAKSGRIIISDDNKTAKFSRERRKGGAFDE